MTLPQIFDQSLEVSLEYFVFEDKTEAKCS